MRRGREQAELIKRCAAAHGVTPRAVRKWRDGQDPRWVKFLAERAAAGSLPVGACAVEAGQAGRSWTEEELALATQIRRMKEITADLRERAELARQAEDLEAEMALRRMWLQHTETLRRLEKDAPSIQKESGDVVNRRMVEQVLVGYAANVRSLVAMIADRVVSLHPTLPDEVVATIRAEVDEVLRAAAEIRLNDETAG